MLEEADEVVGACEVFSEVSTGVPHCPQKRFPTGTSALHFGHFCLRDEAQFKQIWMPSGF
jgi:hypothetical protein